MEELAFPNVTLTRSIKGEQYCFLDTRGNGGMFANLYCILYGLYICMKNDVAPVIRMEGEKHLYYQKEYGQNIFNYYFKPVPNHQDLMSRDFPVMTIINPAMFIRWARISLSEKKMANFLISQFFILRDEIAHIIDGYFINYFKGYRVLGIHYRGRDKVSETPILAFEEYEKVISNLLNQNICDRLFFCTDELHLRELMKEKYKEKVFFYELEGDYNFHGSVNGNLTTGLHFENPTPYLHGKDAIAECYLLSKCQLMLASSTSSFSLFATFINPHLPHIVMNK